MTDKDERIQKLEERLADTGRERDRLRQIADQSAPVLLESRKEIATLKAENERLKGEFSKVNEGGFSLFAELESTRADNAAKDAAIAMKDSALRLVIETDKKAVAELVQVLGDEVLPLESLEISKVCESALSSNGAGWVSYAQIHALPRYTVSDGIPIESEAGGWVMLGDIRELSRTESREGGI